MMARVATVRMGPGGGGPGRLRPRSQEHPCPGLPFMPFSFVHTADIHLDAAAFAGAAQPWPCREDVDIGKAQQGGKRPRKRLADALTAAGIEVDVVAELEDLKTMAQTAVDQAATMRHGAAIGPIRSLAAGWEESCLSPPCPKCGTS